MVKRDKDKLGEDFDAVQQLSTKEMVRLLLNHGETLTSSQKPMNDMEVVKLLLAKGAKLDATDEGSPLVRRSMSNVEIVNTLLAHGARLESGDLSDVFASKGSKLEFTPPDTEAGAIKASGHRTEKPVSRRGRLKPTQS